MKTTPKSMLFKLGMVVAVTLAAASFSEGCPPNLTTARLMLQRIFAQFPEVYQQARLGQIPPLNNNLGGGALPNTVPNQQLPQFNNLG